MIVADVKKLAGFKFIVPGEHQRENLACAVEVAKLFKIPTARIKNTVKNFKGVEGRLQYLKTVRGVKIYNDNNATTPEATIAGIKALYQAGQEGRIVLLSGGADKKLDLKLYVDVVNNFCKAIALIPGSGTNVLLKDYKLKIPHAVGKNFKDAISKGLEFAERGDILLFSPAFASFGLFNNEYERNDQFVKLVKNLIS
jgi:UDP-N-acetylmuramoylalanine--D-glutamate ligase